MFLLFGGEPYEEQGGYHDFIEEFTSVGSAMVAGQSFGWWHVVDKKTNKIVLRSARDGGDRPSDNELDCLISQGSAG